MGPEVLAAAVVASTVLQGASMVGQARTAKAQAGLASQAAARDAQILTETRAEQARRVRLQAARLHSSQLAAAGASGARLGGSSFAVMAETAAEAELDALQIERAGSVEAANALFSGAQENFRLRSESRRSLLGAGATLLNGASRVSQIDFGEG